MRLGTVVRRHALGRVALTMLLAGGTTAGVVIASAAPSGAADGNILRTVTAQGYSCSVGTGIAFDGTNLLLSCNDDNKITAISPADGSLVATHTISGITSIGAIAWDRARNLLWACGGFSGDDEAVHRISLVDDAATTAFTEGPGCPDGLAYDGSDDTLWLSPDVSPTVYHYTLAGSEIASYPANVGGCGNSGIAVGGPYLFLANNGCSEIYRAPRATPTETTLFGSYPARLEDMECDDLTFQGAGKAAIWSKDAYDGVLNAFELNPGDCGYGGQPPGPLKSLVGLGDSIAAGHGVGPSTWRPDDPNSGPANNPNAYPTLVGKQHGYTPQDHAISGACVGRAGDTNSPFPIDARTAKGCPSDNVNDEVRRLVASGARPDVITLTVGANDIRFSDCFRFIAGMPTESGDDPCSGQQFSTDLAAYKVNLANLLRYLKENYPAARIIVTKYFDPLPFFADGTPCRLFYIGYAMTNPGRFTQQLLQGGRGLDNAVRSYEDAIGKKALRIIAQLNGAIGSVAQAAGASSVPVNYLGHDLCGQYENYEPYVFAPEGQVTLTGTYHKRSVSKTFSLTAKEDCTDCADDPHGSFRKVLYNGAGIKLSVSGTWSVDGSPHPTRRGQQEIADAVATALPQPGSTVDHEVTGVP